MDNQPQDKLLEKYSGMGDAFNVVSTYTGGTAYLATELGGIPETTISKINGVSSVTGFLAVAPSAHQAFTNPSIETISIAAGNIVGAIAGFPVGLLAGPETTATVKAAGTTAKITAEVNQAITKNPLGVLEALFNRLVTFK